MKQTNQIETIKKSNLLISSKYNSSILENKLLTLGLLRAQEEDGRIISRLTTGELKQYLWDKDKKISGSFYTQIKQAADEMIDRKIFIEDKENNRFVIMGLIGVVKYENNILEIKFEPDMTDYILNVKSNYTNLNIPILMSFKKNYSYRLYEILKSMLYERYRNWENDDVEEFRVDFELAELKLSIGVVDMNEKDVKHELRRGKLDLDTIVSDISKNKKFENWSNFKFCVINPAITEINEKSDINVRYSLTRTGNGGKVTGISFFVNKKSMLLESVNISKSNIPDEKTILDMIEELKFYIEESLAENSIRTLLKAANWDVNTVKNAYDLAEQQENIDNLVGWLMSAIKGQYELHNVSKSKEYDYGGMTYLQNLLDM